MSKCRKFHQSMLDRLRLYHSSDFVQFHSNPNKGKSTVTFWMKIVSPPATPQTILGTGRKTDNTGIFLQISNYGRTLVAECIDYSSYVSFQYAIGETLFSWTHVAMVEDRVTGEFRNFHLLVKSYIHGSM